jgi:hypothetical protein
MRTLILYVVTAFSLALVLTAPSCAKAPPSLSPTGTAAFQATRVVKALDVLQDFAIAAEAQTPKLLTTEHTRTVIDFVAASVKTIGAVPSGWKPPVVAALAQLQKDVLPAEWARLLPYIALVQSLIEVTP